MAREGEELPLPVLEQGGERFIPVFTSPKQLARYAPGGTDFLRLKGRALASVWPEDCRLALNPRGDVGLILDPEQVKAAEDAPARGEAPGFFVGEPKEEPVELLEAMRKLAARRPEIRAAYRALVVRRPGAKPEHVIGLELDPHSDRDLVIDTAVEAARPLGLTHVAFVPLVTGVDAGAVGRFMLERTTPFWERETRG